MAAHSRNQGQQRTELQLTQNSTVKMEKSSMKGDGRKEPSIVHKIIPPESQIGQVYQKTNVGLYQRSVRSSITKSLQQKMTPREAGKYGNGISLTDFNSKLLFDGSATTTALKKPTEKGSKVNRIQERRRLRNKGGFGLSGTQSIMNRK